MNKKYSKDFGNKEFLLNYANRRWGLTKTNKVGEVMALIRECQPLAFEDWEQWYFENARTNTKKPIKVTRDVLSELGERLYIKLKEIVIPQVEESIRTLTVTDCIEYIYHLTICRTYDGFLTEKSVVNDYLRKKFPDVIFEETNPELDHAGDIDYLAKVGEKSFGIQIKPITANASLGNYAVTARMEESFRTFEEEFGGKVFVVFSTSDKIKNIEVLEAMEQEIRRLQEEERCKATV